MEKLIGSRRLLCNLFVLVEHRTNEARTNERVPVVHERVQVESIVAHLNAPVALEVLLVCAVGSLSQAMLTLIGFQDALLQILAIVAQHFVVVDGRGIFDATDADAAAATAVAHSIVGQVGIEGVVVAV